MTRHPVGNDRDPQSVVTLPAIAMLGCGSMGGAIVSGLLSPAVLVSDGIRVTTRTTASAAAFPSDSVRAFSLDTTPNANALAVNGAKLVVLAVKPHLVVELLESIAAHLDADAVVVSVAAGIRTASLEAVVPNPVLRAMPNTPAIVGLGVTGLAAGSRATAEHLALGRRLFETVGTVLEVAEDHIDALSAISGSGPAYVYYFIEQFTNTAVRLGFSPSDAAVMVRETFRGASELLHTSGIEPTELRRRVTSPGGTTERAIAAFADADLAALIDTATAAAIARAQELAAG